MNSRVGTAARDVIGYVVPRAQVRVAWLEQRTSRAVPGPAPSIAAV